MRLAIISKARHGPLMAFLRDAGLTQAEFARRNGITPGIVNELACLKFRRLSDHYIAKISEATGLSAHELVPPDLRRWMPGKPLVNHSEIEIPESVLLDIGIAVPMLEASTSEEEHHDAEEEVQALLKRADLTLREKVVLQSRFGLNGSDAKTLDGTSKIVKVTRERVRQIEKKALRKLRDAAEEREKA